MLLERLLEVILDPHQRVQPGHRLLEDRARGPGRGAAQVLRPTCRRDSAPRRAPRRRTAAPSGSSPRMPRPSVDLPQPDSPTRPTISPAPMSSETPSTARTGPPRGAVVDPQVADRDDRRVGHGASRRWLDLGGKSTVDLGARAEHRVDRLVQPLAEQREARDEEHDREPREQARPPDSGRRVRHRTLDVVAPLRRFGRLDPVAEEPERGQREDRVGGVQRRERRNVLDDVEEDVLADDGERPRAEGPRGLDVGLLADADGVVADDAEVEGDVGDRDRDGRGEDSLARCFRRGGRRSRSRAGGTGTRASRP